MMNTFIDIEPIDILSEKEYEKETGNLLDNIEQSIIVTETVDGKHVEVTKGTGVIDVANIVTKNSFINKVQDTQKEKIRQEKIRLDDANIEFPYIKNTLMTDAEIQLFNFMRNNLCHIEKILIFPKVRLADIIQVDTKVTVDKKYLWKITNKHVDYVICRADNMQVICVVELDDYTHETAEAKERDIFVMQALRETGIKTFRIRSKIKVVDRSDLELIDEEINTEFAPNCPYCGIKMIPRKCASGKNRGHRFYGCPNFIDCRRTIDIDKIGEQLP